jgi:hypothetical protein
MADEQPVSDAPEASEGVAAESAPPAPSIRRRIWKWTFFLLGLPFIVFAVGITIWSLVALNWTYSTGDRAGYVQKFSKKGWICKTWEGELSMVNIPGAAQERWEFTVRDDSIANAITNLMGSRVSLHYEEHPGIPTSCFGETSYYVTGVRQVAGP